MDALLASRARAQWIHELRVEPAVVLDMNITATQAEQDARRAQDAASLKAQRHRPLRAFGRQADSPEVVAELEDIEMYDDG